MAGIRRVVLGADDEGRTTVRFDGTAPAVTQLPAVPGTSLVDIWGSEALPMQTGAGGDPTAGNFELMPTGSLFRIIDLAPTGKSEPMWHQTNSVDLIYIASGSLTCLHEGGQADLVGRRHDRPTGYPPRLGQLHRHHLPTGQRQHRHTG